MQTQSSTTSSIPWPTEIRLNKTKDWLELVFNTGENFSLSAEFLRVYSPSAEVRGHSGQERKIIEGKQSVRILNIESIGNYAVKLIFSDGHDTGLYSWSYLHHLGTSYEAKWQDYLKALEERRLQR